MTDTNTNLPGADLPSREECAALVPAGTLHADKVAALLHAVADVAGWSRYELKLGRDLRTLQADIAATNALEWHSKAWWDAVRNLHAARRRICEYAARYKIRDQVPEWACSSISAMDARTARREA